MGNALSPAHLLIILLIIVLLFGAAKLPGLAKSLGQSARVFKGEMKAMKDDDATASTGTTAPASAAATQADETTPAPAVKNSDNPI